MDDDVNRMVRAKFTCVSVIKTLSGNKDLSFTWTYHFIAVYGNSEENKKFWQYTPSGSVDLSSINQDLFEVGKEYYLDFSPAL
jgi:hypothetical protein